MIRPLHETPHIDGVDVAQLLRDIGEASASTDPVYLFGLCIGAQRVLSGIAVATIAADGEAALMAAFRAMDDEAREYLLKIANGQARRHPRHRRPRLTLVPAGLYGRGR